jgi:hypothetical protein
MTLAASTVRMPKLSHRLRRRAAPTAASSDPAVCWSRSCQGALIAANLITSFVVVPRDSTKIDTLAPLIVDRSPLVLRSVATGAENVPRADCDSHVRVPTWVASSGRIANSGIVASAWFGSIAEPSATPRAYTVLLRSVESTTAKRYVSASRWGK